MKTTVCFFFLFYAWVYPDCFFFFFFLMGDKKYGGGGGGGGLKFCLAFNLISLREWFTRDGCKSMWEETVKIDRDVEGFRTGRNS